MPRHEGDLAVPETDRTSSLLQSLAGRSGPDVYDKLLEVMQNPSTSVRRRAAEILASKGPVAAEYVKQKFATLDDNQKHGALTALAWVQGSAALAWMSSLFSSKDASTDALLRSAIIDAVGEIEGDPSTAFLMRALRDDSWLNRYSAAEALEKKGQAVVEPLKRAFSEGKGDIKFWSLQLLVRIYGAGSIQLLTSCMGLEDADIRHCAILALGESDERWAIELLIEGLEDLHWANRRLCSRFLVGKGKPAVEPLLGALQPQRPERTHEVLRTLAKIGDEAMVGPVSQLALQVDGARADEIREWCVQTLGVVHTETTARRLIELAQDFTSMRAAIHQALVPFGAPAVRFLLKAVVSRDAPYRDFCRNVIDGMDLAGAQALWGSLQNLKGPEVDAIHKSMRSISPRALEDVLKDPEVKPEWLVRLAEASFNPDQSAISRIQVPVSPEELKKYLTRPSGEVVEPLASYPTSLDEILVKAVKAGASDVHLKVGLPPILRIEGGLRQQSDLPPLTRDTAWEIITHVVPEQLTKKLLKEKELDTSYQIANVGRFRVNLYSESNGFAVAFRIIPTTVPRLEDLSLPKVFWNFCNFRHGLLLISGPTGSGKSTTLAAMINHINDTREEHILTIEDPIEFKHAHKKCLITNRELQIDTLSFATALRSALREDPDIVLVGEMRDRETVSLALTAAETGHYVLSTLHTGTAAEGIERLINVFPGDQHASIRNLISTTLRAIVCQILLPGIDSKRVLGMEVLVVNYAVSNLIREMKLQQLDQVLVTGRSEGNISRDDHLYELFSRGRISKETALNHCRDRRGFEEKLGRDRPARR